jgi:hypothetical protein
MKNFSKGQRAAVIAVVIIFQIALDAFSKYLARSEVRRKAEEDLGRSVS